VKNELAWGRAVVWDVSVAFLVVDFGDTGVGDGSKEPEIGGG